MEVFVRTEITNTSESHHVSNLSINI